VSTIDPVAVTDFIAAYDRAAAGTANLLAGLDRTSDAIPASDWTVREAAVHLICWGRFYRRFLDGLASPVRDAQELEVMNAAYFTALDEDDPGPLAALMREATTAYSAKAATLRADELCPWHMALSLEVRAHVALLINELLMHGWDIANATGRRLWDDEAATPVFTDIAALWALFVPSEPSRPEATLAFSIDGRLQSLYRLHAGGASVGPVEPESTYDCIVDGSPFALLLWLAGRAGWEAAGLTISGPQPEVGRLFRR
jgi:uncharacterized protein (TIGR03083 family)